MNQNIGFCQFTDAFRDHDRQEQFSYDGLKALYDYLIQYEDDTGESIELDVIALCCDYVEYKNLKELKRDYSSIKSMKDLEDNTQVINFDGGLIIQQF